MEPTLNMYDEIKENFEGKIPPFLKAIGEADQALLRVVWSSYKRVLFHESELLNKRTKCMMLFETVRGHSKCQACADMHIDTLREIGLGQDAIDELRSDFSASRLLDEETKNILIFTLYLSGFDSKSVEKMDNRMLEGFQKLVGKNKLTEIILLVATSKNMQDFIHLSQVGH